MSALRLAWTELRRITATRGIVVVLLALLLVPTLHGGMYLYANRDPYGSVSNIPAALVVEDAGATTSAGKQLHAGQDLATQLLADRSFAWQEVDAATAADGLRSGRFDFAVTVPAGFSTALTTLGTAQSQQATIGLTTNDSTSYLARTIATSATERIRSALAAEVSAEAASTMLVGFATIADQLGTASDGATKLVAGTTSATSGATRLATGASTLADGTSTLATGATHLATGAATTATGAAQVSSGSAALAAGLDRLATSTSTLPAQSRQLADGAAQTSAGAASLATGGASLHQGSQDVTDGLAQLAAGLRSRLTAAGLPAAQVDAVVAQTTALQQGSAQVTAGLGSLTSGAQDLSAGTTKVATGAQALAAAAPALTSGIASASSASVRLGTGAAKLATGTASLSSGATSLASGATTAAAGAAKVASGTGTLATGLGSLVSGATSLQHGLATGAASVPVVDSSARATVASDLATPVVVNATNESKASTYGAGLAPFFLVLALWIGAYTLFLLVRPLSRRAIAADQKSWQVALGGWLTPAVLGVVQAVLVTLVVSRWVGVAPSNPVLTVAFMALVSVTFIAINQALGAWFGPAGQFVALILMILQLVSSGGTFPWQTLPHPLWALHDALPMSHAIEALRQLFYGGDLSLVVSQLLVLLAYLGGALLLTTLAARRQRTWTPSRLEPVIVL